MNKRVRNQQRAALAGWEDEGGAGPSDSALATETERDKRTGHTNRRAAFDAAHDSSPRGEHRYPDSQQTEEEQKARHDRDDLKRKLGGKR